MRSEDVLQVSSEALGDFLVSLSSLVDAGGNEDTQHSVMKLHRQDLKPPASELRTIFRTRRLLMSNKTPAWSRKNGPCIRQINRTQEEEAAWTQEVVWAMKIPG